MPRTTTPRDAQPSGAIGLATFAKDGQTDVYQGAVIAYVDAEGDPVDIDSTNRLPVAANVSGTVTVANIASTVSIDNYPTTQAVSGTLSVSNTVAVTGPLTDAQLRATAVPVSASISGTPTVNVSNSSLVVTGPITNTELRAAALPISGTVAVSNIADTVNVSNFPATQPVSGTVAVGNLPSTQTVNVSNSSIAVTGPITDAELRATAVPVAVVSGGGGGSSDSTASGTINANGQEVVLSSMNGINAVSIQVSGSYSGTLAVQIKHATGDGWTTISGTSTAYSNSGLYSAGANWSPGSTGVFSCYCHGAAFMRITSTAWTSGTATISLRANSVGPTILLGALPAGSNSIGSVSIVGSVNIVGSVGITGGVTQSGTWNIGTVTTCTSVGSITTSIVPGVGATHLGKAEDAVAASGDTGVAILGVRKDTFTATATTSANGDYSQISTDKHGAVYSINSNARKPTTSFSCLIVPAASATDIVTIEGPGSGTIRVSRIIISGTQTTAGHVLFALIRRNGTNSGGTFTNPTQFAHELAVDSAGAANIKAYTANPSGLGGVTAYVRRLYKFIPAATTAGDAPPLVWDFGSCGKEISVGSGALLSLSLEGATVTGGSLAVDIEYYSE